MAYMHDVLVDTDKLVEALYDAVCANDLPGMADIDSSLLLFCNSVKKDATVALSGECAIIMIHINTNSIV